MDRSGIPFRGIPAPGTACIQSVLGFLALAMIWGCASSGPSQRYDELSESYDRELAIRDTARMATATDLFPRNSPLEREDLVAAVLARNPSLETARQGWRAALARYPQAKALEDPMLTYELAPASIASDDVRFGQSFKLSQNLPLPGKRGLRGAVAVAEAEAETAWKAAAILSLALWSR